MNAQQNISNPMQMSIMHFTGIADIMLINDDGSVSNFSAAEWSQETLNIDLENMHDFYISTEELEQLLQEHGDAITLIPAAQLQAQLVTTQRDFRQYSLWVAAAIIMLASLGAYWVADVIVRPIKKLSGSVREIDADKLHERLPLPKSHDEISQLTIAFNEMLDTLHRSFESKQLFAQNAAHELKTPLTIIRANMETLEMDDTPTVDDYKEVFGEVKNSTERMINLVEGLLEMGRASSGVGRTVFQAREIFEDIIEDLEETIRIKRLDAKIIGDVTIKGEKTLLRQTFFNLVHNAVRYNVEGGNIAVTLSQHQITIADTGIGIPPESLGQLFDPFYCVDKSRAKKLGGNGLGLAITKHILDAHQMRINVTSKVGAGTLVSIHI
ncbi:MAG: HAMP domain-containing histidine kinase [Oscillospiraceae bacterium]|nr:HAMP domain-containing histidine kinase [Oscillospiraceae bacterium]